MIERKGREDMKLDDVMATATSAAVGHSSKVEWLLRLLREQVEQYAAEQVAAETERCALICDNCHTTQGAAERIRARGET